MVVQNSREREGQRRAAEHLRAKEERKRLRMWLLVPKPKAGRQARLMSWAIGNHLPLEYGFGVPEEFEREWCEKINYSMARWNEDKLRFPWLMEKAFQTLRVRRQWALRASRCS